MSNKIAIFTLLILGLNFQETFSALPKCPKRPHVIFIMADDLGWNDVGFHGDDEISTPNIDALAYSGVILNNYYVQSICTPSRAALLTGMYPIHTGLQHSVIKNSQPYGLPLDFKLLPQYLKSLGYTSRIVGKWHLGLFEKEYTPTFRGFDSHYGYWNGMIDYYNHGSAYYGTIWGYDFRKDMEVEYAGQGTYATDLFAEESVRIINEHNSSEPLFLYLSHLAPHVGNKFVGEALQAPPEVIEKFSYIEDKNRRIYAAMVWKLDESVGELLRALDKNEMLKDSIIVFSTDNGGSTGGYESSGALNWPLRGSKIGLWEGGIRGSAFIWSSLMKNPGRVSTEMMHITDWLPTLYNAIGGDISDLPPLDGMNVWKSLQGKSSSPRKEFLVNIDPMINGASVRSNEWKLVFNPSYLFGQYDGWYGPSGRLSSINSSSKEKEIQNSLAGKAVKKLMPTIFRKIKALRNDAMVSCDEVPENATLSCNDFSNPCLFNISSDPCEYYDVSKLYPSVVEDLMDKIRSYNSTQVPPLNKPFDPRGDPKHFNGTWTNWFDLIDQNSISNA